MPDTGAGSHFHQDGVKRAPLAITLDRGVGNASGPLREGLFLLGRQTPPAPGRSVDNPNAASLPERDGLIRRDHHADR